MRSVFTTLQKFGSAISGMVGEEDLPSDTGLRFESFGPQQDLWRRALSRTLNHFSFAIYGGLG